MLRLLPEAKRVCCPACGDVELRLIAGPNGADFLACEQCLRRFAAVHERKWGRDAGEAAAAMPGPGAGRAAA
jgi:hypothetical protein